MNNHLLSQFFNVDEEHLLAAAESFASAGPQIWPASNPVYVKMEDSGDDASSNASWGFTATSTTPMDYDDAPATINCIPGGLAQISLPGSSRSPSPDMTLPGGFNFAAASQQQQQQKPVSAIPAHLRPREAALSPSSLVSPPVVPTLLQQQQQLSSPTQPSKSNGRKLNSTTTAAPPSPESPTAPELLNGQPHPYSISATNTTALFTRASSVSSTASGPTKKGRAPPSGPISTKDFVPPDVSGLSKREARLVKNRAAAFLSRQRKREEFEGLEARVEVLEMDNARLYKELEGYRSGSSSATAAPAPALAPSGATPAALQAELVGLRRQLGARDQELAKLHGRMQAINAEANAERERVAEKDAEIAQLKRQLASRGSAVAAAAKDDDSDSDSEDAQSTADGMVATGKKDLKSAGSMAFMVLLFSLSSLLTSAESSGSAKPPVASERVRRPGMHHRDSSRTYLDLPQQAFSNGLAYDSFLSTSDASMMLSPSFGFDEDSLLGGSSAFVGLSSSTPSPTQPPRQQQQQPKVQDNNVADSLASAISGVKSISPEEFEFDFTVPSTSSSSLDSFAFPARPKQDKAGKKIRVCVKSALPLNLNLDALSTKVASSSAPATSQKVKENDLFASSLGYRVPETDDLLFWSGAASTFGGSSSPSSVLSPTMSTASSESRKRKRVVVEINPRGGSRRRLSEENDGDDEMDTWDVKFSEDDDLLAGASDEDVMMRL
ncbi:hypothetical protein M407DRAFT_175924 [Tulasnella calospora MUT 4182]|uniref:BZIP domain-containing protein n=1 Tax=Tulasnella calospora MUT 4182 TaxID=1051891 RepID=A0A0C3QDC3_9AGAM|nr:hypothetical protein M407DRAFT_175924 [Tulasnella calospora MUT 4182]